MIHIMKWKKSEIKQKLNHFAFVLSKILSGVDRKNETINIHCRNAVG